MEPDEIMTALKDFFAREMLDGQDNGLDAHTPLLALGMINSMSIIMLKSFIKERFSVEIPTEQLVAENLEDLATITNLVRQLRTL